MNSFLEKKKTLESYYEKISTEPIGTQRNKKYAIRNFSDFVRETYDGRTILNVIDELNIIKTTGQEKYEDSLYETIQKWINWNESKGIGNYTIRTVFSNLRKYLFFLGIKTHEQEIKEYLRFGKVPKEERHPLSQQEFRAIVDGFSRNPWYQALFLTLGHSGMRIGEALSLKKKDLDISVSRIKVNIPADTKTRRGRSTFLSKEVEAKLKPRLEEIGLDDYIFCKSTPPTALSNVKRALLRLLQKLGLDEKYQSNGFSKITSHSFRAYFFTKAARKHGENYAHRMTGHGGYLMQYDRMTEDEKLEMYLQLEPDLIIYDQTRNEIEIEKLRRENQSIEDLREEVKRLREQQVNSDKKILDKLRNGGIIPSL